MRSLSLGYLLFEVTSPNSGYEYQNFLILSHLSESFDVPAGPKEGTNHWFSTH